jgi:hypothetical protein
MADTNLVIDVAVRDRHVRQDEIGEVKPFQHLADDQSAVVLVGANRLIALGDRRVSHVTKRFYLTCIDC